MNELEEGRYDFHDQNISHVNSKVYNEIVYHLEESLLRKTRGNVHDFLGMTLDHSQLFQVRVSLQNYIRSLVKDPPEGMTSKAPTPAANHLFTVNKEKPVQLNMDNRILFHHLVAMLFFWSKFTRRDIQTALYF